MDRAGVFYVILVGNDDHVTSTAKLNGEGGLTCLGATGGGKGLNKGGGNYDQSDHKLAMDKVPGHIYSLAEQKN